MRTPAGGGGAAVTARSVHVLILPDASSEAAITALQQDPGLGRARMGYTHAPWTFKGRALYQLQLVKADEARKHVPPELKLVEAFGYTLGGIYLARYDDSPAGSFDECVVMAGLVWNPPTSCAWAARVFVNNTDARNHGLTSVGLPSRLASFSSADLRQAGGRSRAWWHAAPPAGNSSPASSSSSSSSSSASPAPPGWEAVVLGNAERGARGLQGRPVATFWLPPASSQAGPRLTLSLPSFSGGTREHPGLLQYSCDLTTNILPVTPMRVQLPSSSSSKDAEQQQQQGRRQRPLQQQAEVLDLLLSGKPLVCLAFSDMLMRVEEPQRLALPAAAAATRGGAAHQESHLVPALATVLPHK